MTGFLSPTILSVILATFLASCVGHSPLASSKVSPPDPVPVIADVAPPVIVYLVRHGEKETDDTRDPGLTEAGVARANGLADLLQGVELVQVHSTNYRRTRDTAMATAKRQGIGELTYYVGNDLDEVAGKIIARGGIHLVVGHSNTTNVLAYVLSGKASPGIREDEYDRLYIITRHHDKDSTLAIVRYGPGF